MSLRAVWRSGKRQVWILLGVDISSMGIAGAVLFSIVISKHTPICDENWYLEDLWWLWGKRKRVLCGKISVYISAVG